MSEPNYMWGDIFPPKGQRDFTEKDMVKVAAMHAESQAEIVALRAERDRLREALAWYEFRARMMIRTTTSANAAVYQLEGDAGAKARAALAGKQP